MHAILSLPAWMCGIALAGIGTQPPSRTTSRRVNWRISRTPSAGEGAARHETARRAGTSNLPVTMSRARVGVATAIQGAGLNRRAGAVDA